MGMMHRRLLALALVTGLPAWGGPERDPDSFHQTIFFAVLEGLYADGVATVDVEAILRLDLETRTPENFVPGCPICGPARDALEVYRARPAWREKKNLGDTFGPGLEEATRAALWSADRAVRLQAIEGLIGRWLGRRLALMRLSDTERRNYEIAFEDMRKKGMSGLRSPGSPFREDKRCAVCDGAFGATRR